MLRPKIKKSKGVVSTLGVIIVVSTLGIAGLAERQYSRLTSVGVWTTAESLPAGYILQAKDVQTSRVNANAEPLAIKNVGDILGRRLLIDKQAGEVIKRGELETPKRLGMTDVIPPGRVIYTLTPDKELLPYTRQLRTGDSFDILTTASGGRVTPLAYDVLLLGNLKAPEAPPVAKRDGVTGSMLETVLSSSPSANDTAPSLLVLAVKPEDVFPLASALGSEGRISLVAHSKTSNGDNDRLTIQGPPSRERNVEVISGLQRSYVRVRKDMTGES